MNRWSVKLGLAALVLMMFPSTSPAPLIYTPGVGWSYERVGKEGKWHRTRAKEQLAVAKEAFEAEDWRRARKAAERTVKNWPLSDYAPEAQYLLGRSYEETGYDEKAFEKYQELVEKYPKFDKYDEVLERQYVIANKYLDGKWFKLWGYIPILPSMEKTSVMYKQLIENGPYSEVAPNAHLKLAEAKAKQEDYPEAVKAVEKTAERYNDRDEVAADALYRAGLFFQKQSKSAEYDQNAAAQAIGKFEDFRALYPKHEMADDAKERIDSLRTEQARGSFKIAKRYEKKKNWRAAQIYYNDVLIKDPNSSYAAEAKQRIEMIKLILDEFEDIQKNLDSQNTEEETAP